MSSVDDLLIQLSQVNDAIKFSKSNEEKETLKSLKNDLNELIRLTNETIKYEKPTKSIDDEFALYMSEIKSLDENISASSSSKPSDDEIVGKKCSAPFNHSWGATTYYNAMICSLDDDMKVRVLFTNPTHEKMIPCRFYLDGHCKFDLTDKCRYSHGELVSYSKLKDYKPPNFDLLTKKNCPALVKRSDNLWHKSIITAVDFDKKLCHVKLEGKKESIECLFENVSPIDDDDSDDESFSDDDVSNIQQTYLIEQNFNRTANEMLGEWEKHTRGIGSKLMEKMGYIHGEPLGSKGIGIINPISAQILPQGCSLDHCMNLREQANGDKNLFSVEKKLKRLKKKQEQINVKAYEKQAKQTDVFSFINQRVFNQAPKSVVTKEKSKSTDLKSESGKNLNVAEFKITENIRKKEKEISTLNQSMSRHKVGTPVYLNLKTQLGVKKLEMENLRKSENSIKNEKASRHNKTKLSIF